MPSQQTNPWNETNHSGFECHSLPELLHYQSENRPDDVAVTHGYETLTFKNLLKRASECAATLQEKGVSQDDCVALLIEPSIDMVVAVWGIILAGAAYLPLAAEYPDERLGNMLEDAKVNYSLTNAQSVLRLRELTTRPTEIVLIDECASSDNSTATRFARRAVEPSSVAYVIFTSGSTGNPKGVAIEHCSIAHQLQWLQSCLQINENSVILLKTPLSFDAAQWEVLANACGSHVVVGGANIHRAPNRITQLILKHGITTIQCVPTLLKALLESDKFRKCTSLKQIMCGGEALPKKLVNECFSSLADCSVINLYGPTECTINASAFIVPGHQSEGVTKTVSIGEPVTSTYFYVLNEKMDRVECGEVGELYIGGIQLARGYLNNPTLTAEKFVKNPYATEGSGNRLYKTGDLVRVSRDGTYEFAGRKDNQVKFRGYRIELDEIKAQIENHDWVKDAAVIVVQNERSGTDNILACVELSPRQATLMDQGTYSVHHATKSEKSQISAQLSNAGCRKQSDLVNRESFQLPGKTPLPRQTNLAFARKSYRHFEGKPSKVADLIQLLDGEVLDVVPREVDDLTIDQFGEVLRYFGQFHSDERLLPKYAYASPGALYATQLYVEVPAAFGLQPGIYYYHPVHHSLHLISSLVDCDENDALRFHFVGKKSAIEPIYKNNIREVLQIESGHMIAVLDKVLIDYGLGVGELSLTTAKMPAFQCEPNDYYLCCVPIVSHPQAVNRQDISIYIQANNQSVEGLAEGLHVYDNGRLCKLSDECIEKHHVIAINQSVYQRSSFGISLVSNERFPWKRYTDLGRKLQTLQMNDNGFGLMSSGYSSETGNDLPTSKQLKAILSQYDISSNASYFAVAGQVSNQQQTSRGMKEDLVHMSGPAELIQADLRRVLPPHMMPSNICIFDRLPHSANGKINVQELREMVPAEFTSSSKTIISPTSYEERCILSIWQDTLGLTEISIDDSFFGLGGDSLQAVEIVLEINKKLDCNLPLQSIFDGGTISELAVASQCKSSEPASRIIPLSLAPGNQEVFCWPGLGGYPLNLKHLCESTKLKRTFYGVQAYGLNAGEVPYLTIAEMAERDIASIKRVQPKGPYRLWGYSFGARLAFEVAYRLEQQGDQVSELLLMAPGSPIINAGHDPYKEETSFRSKTFTTILFSVFFGNITDPLLAECLKEVSTVDEFVDFLVEARPSFERDFAYRIIDVVKTTYQFKYTFEELLGRTISAPVAIFKAKGDDYSFIEKQTEQSVPNPKIINVDADHYDFLHGLKSLRLRDKIVEHITQSISSVPKTNAQLRRTNMPHVNIKHFPKDLSQNQMDTLVTKITEAVRDIFECTEDVISIALEPVEPSKWADQVHFLELVNRKELLAKTPSYISE